MTQAALQRALADARAYRTLLHAALDELHAAYLRERRLREQLQDVREELECRMGVVHE